LDEIYETLGNVREKHARWNIINLPYIHPIKAKYDQIGRIKIEKWAIYQDERSIFHPFIQRICDFPV